MKKLLCIFLLLIIGFISTNPIGIGETLLGLRHSALGDPGTFVYTNEQNFMLAWSSRGHYAFVLLDGAGQWVKTLPCGGQKCDWKSMVEFIQWIESQGWHRISSEKIPANILSVLMSYNYFLIALGMKTLPQLFLLPIFDFQLQERSIS